MVKLFTTDIDSSKGGKFNLSRALPWFFVKNTTKAPVHKTLLEKNAWNLGRVERGYRFSFSNTAFYLDVNLSLPWITGTGKFTYLPCFARSSCKIASYLHAACNLTGHPYAFSLLSSAQFRLHRCHLNSEKVSQMLCLVFVTVSSSHPGCKVNNILMSLK